MRIAFITYEYPPDTGKGGIGTYTSQVAAMLANRGWDVHVFAGSHTRNDILPENNITIHWVQCSDPHNFKQVVVSSFEKEYSNQRFELIESPEIHGNAQEIKKAFPQLSLIVRLHAPNSLVEQLKQKYLPFKTKIRFVLGALRRGKIDAGYWRKYAYWEDADYQFCLFADKLSAPSAAMKKWVVEKWKLPAVKIKLLPNPFSAPNAFLQLPVYDKPVYKTIVFFGRLNVLKGLVNATYAMKKILAEFPDYRFKVIGDDGIGPHPATTIRQWMQEQLKEVNTRVLFVDGLPYEKLPAAITDAEIALLPSLFESFSYTCAEAMAAGKAVVASRYTGMAEIIEHNKTGVLVDAENVPEIYNAIKKLILQNEFRYTLSLNARKSIASKYNDDILTNAYMDFYQHIAFTSE